MAERIVRLWTAAALCCLCLWPSTQSTGDSDRTLATAEPSVRPAVSEYVMLVGQPSVSVYTPLDANASALLLNDTDAVPNYASCAYFNGSVYCVGKGSVQTWRFSHVDGRPLPYGPDLNSGVQSPGQARGGMANINDEWLVADCGLKYYHPAVGGDLRLISTCQVLHVNASQWVEIESEDSETCGGGGWLTAVAEHNGSVFVAGGWCGLSGAKAEVRSLQVSCTSMGSDTLQWRRQADLNTARYFMAMASHKGYLYACGGVRSSSALSVCERWQEGMHSWQSIAPLPEPRKLLHMLSVDGRLIALGGFDSDGDYYKLDVFDYDEAEDTWSRLHDMPNVHNMRQFGSAVVPAL